MGVDGCPTSGIPQSSLHPRKSGELQPCSLLPGSAVGGPEAIPTGKGHKPESLQRVREQRGRGSQVKRFPLRNPPLPPIAHPSPTSSSRLSKLGEKRGDPASDSAHAQDRQPSLPTARSVGGRLLRGGAWPPRRRRDWSEGRTVGQWERTAVEGGCGCCADWAVRCSREVFCLFFLTRCLRSPQLPQTEQRIQSVKAARQKRLRLPGCWRFFFPPLLGIFSKFFFHPGSFLLLAEGPALPAAPSDRVAF